MRTITLPLYLLSEAELTALADRAIDMQGEVASPELSPVVETLAHEIRARGVSWRATPDGRFTQHGDS
jgi:hypothetical protein